MPSRPAPPGELFDPREFSGVARLFPLPGAVLFPGLGTVLHVFEERYRALTRDALATDGLIGMAVLRPGWETDYAGRPPLEPIGCLAKITTQYELEDGRFNLLLMGVSRFRLGAEIAPPQAFRRVRAELVETEEPPPGDPTAASLRRRLLELASRVGPLAPPITDLPNDFPLGALADYAAYALSPPGAVMGTVLAELSAVARMELVVRAFRERDADSPGVPPPFSEN